MDKDTKDILETVNFIKDHMVTKADFDDAVEKLDGRLTAVESKIGGIHNRIDDEALKRANLENRVRLRRSQPSAAAGARVVRKATTAGTAALADKSGTRYR
jgi:hypothetical protein